MIKCTRNNNWNIQYKSFLIVIILKICKQYNYHEFSWFTFVNFNGVYSSLNVAIFLKVHNYIYQYLKISASWEVLRVSGFDPFVMHL